MRKIAGYLTKNRSGKDQKIAQSTHGNGYIKPRKTFWRNSKQLLRISGQFGKNVISLKVANNKVMTHYPPDLTEKQWQVTPKILEPQARN